jgi:hypothetical protein
MSGQSNVEDSQVAAAANDRAPSAKSPPVTCRTAALWLAAMTISPSEHVGIRAAVPQPWSSDCGCSCR